MKLLRSAMLVLAALITMPATAGSLQAQETRGKWVVAGVVSGAVYYPIRRGRYYRGRYYRGRYYRGRYRRARIDSRVVRRYRRRVYYVPARRFPPQRSYYRVRNYVQPWLYYYR